MEDLMAFGAWLLDLAVWSMFWFFVFRAIRWIFDMRAAVAEAGELREEMVETLGQIMHGVRQEKHADVVYWFDEDSDAFLAQGRTTDEIRAHLKQRWRDHIFLINGTHVMAGPDYELHEATDADKMGQVFANKMIDRMKAQGRL
jgi:hypothetical protein